MVPLFTFTVSPHDRHTKFSVFISVWGGYDMVMIPLGSLIFYLTPEQLTFSACME